MEDKMKKTIFCIAAIVSISLWINTATVDAAVARAVPCHNVACDGILISHTEQRVHYGEMTTCHEHPHCLKQTKYTDTWEIVSCNRCGAVDKETLIKSVSEQLDLTTNPG